MEDEENIWVQPISGKLSQHFVFKLDAERKLSNSGTVYCVHCNKKFAFHGSCSSLTYHLKHRHPLDYQTPVDNDSNRISHYRAPTMSLSRQPVKTISERVSIDLNVSIAQWIGGSGLSTRTVEDNRLQDVLRAALQDQTYNLPSRSTIDGLILQVYSEKRAENREALSLIPRIALSSYFWKSHNNDSFCSIKGHWIDDNWDLKSIALGCLRVEEMYVTGNSASFYQMFAETWKIADKISCTVSDNAANMFGTIGQSKYKYIPCIAHCIQKSVLEGLKTEDAFSLLEKCRLLVDYFKYCSVSIFETNTFVYGHIQPNDANVFDKLQRDAPNSWHSTYIMLVNLLEVKFYIVMYQKDHAEQYNGPKLTDVDWEKIEKFVSLLGSIFDAIEYVGRERYALGSAVLPLLVYLRRLLKAEDDDPDYIIRFKTEIYSDFKGRTEGFDDLTTFQMAVVLDPRYKRLSCLKREKREAVWSALWEELRDFADKQFAISQRGLKIKQNFGKTVKTKKRKISLLLSDSDSQCSYNETDAVNDLRIEMTQYQNEPPVPETENPLTWWKLNCHRFPALSSFVKTILSVPATSVTFDELFSSSGSFVNEMPTIFSQENVNIRVCLRDWLK